MAYYSYSCHLVEHPQMPHVSTYDAAPYPEGFPSYSGLDSIEQGLYAYDYSPYYNFYDPASRLSPVASSVCTVSEPEHFIYNPSFYNVFRHDFPFTRFNIFNSQATFNETDFEDYDPTPYGGGYDLAATYGKPLAPSEETCYPPSSSHPNSVPLNGVSLGTVGSPYGKEGIEGDDSKQKDVTKPTLIGNDKQPRENPTESPVPDQHSESKLSLVENNEQSKENVPEVCAPLGRDSEAKPSPVKNSDQPKDNLLEISAPQDQDSETKPSVVKNDEQPTEILPGKRASDDKKSESSDDSESHHGQDSESIDEIESQAGSVIEDCGYNNGQSEKILWTQVPPGYGLEAMDLCESVFGCHWPCLSRAKRLYDDNQRQLAAARDHERTYSDPWKETSDYLFGSVNPYSD